MNREQLLSELGVPKRVRRRLRCASDSDERQVFHVSRVHSRVFDINRTRGSLEFRMLSKWKKRRAND